MAKKTTTNTAAAPAPAQPKRAGKAPAFATGSSCDLSELGLVNQFVDGRHSPYDREIDQLVADTNASGNPPSVGRKYADTQAINGLRRRAEKKGVRLQFLILPDGEGFVVRVDPDPKSRVSRKPTAAAGTAQTTNQTSAA